MILVFKTLKEILPTTNEIPTSMYDTKKILRALGMNYGKIHACPNDCCLYRKELMQLNVLNVVNQGESMLIM